MQTGVIAQADVKTFVVTSEQFDLLYCLCLYRWGSEFILIQDSHIQIQVSCWNNQKDLSVPYY